MPIVDANRLKGNWGAGHVAGRLEGLCLVRAVSSDTDIGLDLYCESVEQNRPFLHFWLQVKTGDQCSISSDGKTASCSFEVDHLQYWKDQPVPVYAALAPSEPNPSSDPDIYIVDMTKRLLLDEIKTSQKTQTLHSDYCWPATNVASVKAFVRQQVPASTALLKLRQGVIGSVPTIDPEYFQAIPLGPVHRFCDVISSQIRRTAAMSVLSLQFAETGSGGVDDFRQRMASVLDAYDGDDHWETHFARAVSAHVDGDFGTAISMYNRTMDIIDADGNARGEEWEYRVLEIQNNLDDAENGRLLMRRSV